MQLLLTWDDRIQVHRVQNGPGQGVLLGAQELVHLLPSSFPHVSTLGAPREWAEVWTTHPTKAEKVPEGWGHLALPAVVMTTAPRAPESSAFGDQSSQICLFLPQQGATIFHSSKKI